jgi:uncharacterized protein
MKRLWPNLLLLLSLLAAPVAVSAQTRHALVIGVDDYRYVPRLRKAVGDARAMGAALRKLGFSVSLLLNPDRSAFNAGISDFTRGLSAGDVALVHYSGHGVALDGENYLLPVDAPRPDRTDKDGLKLEAFALMSLIERVRATGSTVQIAIVDACRDNPYARSGTRAIGRSGGLVEPSRRPAKGQGGFFILFSAGFGQTAADRLSDSDPEPTSVYTRTLLGKIAVEGKPITDLAREVREDVEALAATVNHEQRPAYYDELSGPLFYFAPPRTVASVPAHPPTPTVSAAAPPVPTNPSFDCTRARSADELAVCASPELAALDRLLSQRYYGLAETLPADGLASLRSAQGEWLTLRGRCEANVPCIAQAYRSRIAALQGGGGRQASLAPVVARTTGPPRPSFDCRKAGKPDEIAVCSDVTLAAKDVRLADMFNRYRAQLAPNGQRRLLATQTNWLAMRARCRSDAGCVGEAYDHRIRQIEALLAGR